MRLAELIPPGRAVYCGARMPGVLCSRPPDPAFGLHLARWQSGHAAACKAAYVGSIPSLASNRNIVFAGSVIILPALGRPSGEIKCAQARVAEQVDATDLKSVGRKAVPVRVRLRAPIIDQH